MSRRLELLITLFGDSAVLSAVFFISWKASDINHPPSSWHAIVANLVVLLYWLFLFQTFDLYATRRRVQLMNELMRMFNILVLGMAMALAMTYIMNFDFAKAPGFLPSYATTIGSLLFWRLLWRGFIGEYVKPAPTKVVIFKNGEPSAPYRGLEIVRAESLSEITPRTANRIFRENRIDGVVIESNGRPAHEILNIITRFADSKYTIFVSPQLYPIVYQNFLVQKIPDSNLLKIVFHPLSHWDRFLKRITDLLISAIVLVTVLPVMLFVAMLIKLDTPGPILYRQKRVGFRGRRYELLKFRSMIADAEKHTGPVWARKNDSRVTRMGRIMRPLRLDELPQLFNVLAGDMSFVGPRPERPHFVERFEKEIPLYRLRVSVHPGITGLAQVKYRYDRTLDDVKKKLDCDLEYINNLSLRLDLKILIKTLLTVAKRQGAH